jgi:hypothetical protein
VLNYDRKITIIVVSPTPSPSTLTLGELLSQDWWCLSTFVVLTSVRDQWAKKGSANPDIKVYIGALAGQDGSGYVDPNTLAGYITRAQSTWSSFGGVMLWEASLAVGMAHNLFFYRASSAC